MSCRLAAQSEVFCYAFASPRVGNASFSTDFLAGTGDRKPLDIVAVNKVDKCYRFTHKGDLVPAVPPPWLFGCVADGWESLDAPSKMGGRR